MEIQVKAESNNYEGRKREKMIVVAYALSLPFQLSLPVKKSRIVM